MASGELRCRPTAVSVASLVTGRILYWNGIEASENASVTIAPEAGKWSRDSQARVLNLIKSEPLFGTVTPGRGPSGNDAPYEEELPPDQALLGQLGVPGRPGDGLVGSTFGQIYEAPPVAPPDDPANNDADMFCADLAQLPDGRILVAGGTDFYNQPRLPDDLPTVGGWGVPELEGLRNSRIFNATTKTFSRTKPMKYGRWYPTLVSLPSGKVLVASGVTKLVKNTQASQVRRTETFDPATNRWKENYTGPSSENSLPLYPRLHLMPNGKVFYAGGGQMNGFGPTGWAADEALYAMQQFYNPTTKQWEMVGVAPSGVRGGAFSVMLPLKPPYNKASLLVGGGTALLPTPGSYLASAMTELVTVDRKGTVTTETTGSLANPRWFSTAVVLPDGKVAAFNGADTDEVLVPGPNIPVREAEMYNPATGEWSSIGTTGRDRTYHNSAILLPNGKVLVGGHSPIPAFNHKHMDVPEPFANNHKDASFELYSPPYLFRGPRPIVEYAPKGIAWGSAFNVDLGDDSAVHSVVLSRMPAQTHTMAADARTIQLPFKQSDRDVRVSGPPGGIIAPPGPYYLFVNKKTAKGPVPSMGRIVFVGKTANTAEAYQPMLDGHTNDISKLAVRKIPVAGAAAAASTASSGANAPTAKDVVDAVAAPVVGPLTGSTERRSTTWFGMAASLVLVGAGLALGSRRRRPREARTE